ncbi:TonB-dependent receptor plug domain-containing protein [Shewanella aestuarii]|uniref:TonB-dependent receptor n=1 Tax=Shewanella aestuarii TaxID=1028752 RepID=A0A6G9QP81_9GAMM|nr:TonB-dependent receptor [Shewanella aestuarii]QIR15903.1 TonB-dependent receptor [Shewanella aestuarii]
MGLRFSFYYIAGLVVIISAQSQAANLQNDLDLDLESLMGMDVQATSAMKRTQSSFDTPTSIYVLSKERIINSGATSIPEALKVVPGLVVRQLDNNQWAITTRSVASRFVSKMLVMIDGQSLHTPQFSAVYWETLNVPLYDIERIEVIRGQGGLLWGTNASNGVINIITKNSIDTRGVYLDASAGNRLNYDANVRYGSDIGNKGSFRFYAHGNDQQASKKGSNLPSNDSSEMVNVGTRFDFTPNDRWSGLLQADYNRADMGQNLRAVLDDSNKNIPFSENTERQELRVMARVENRISDSADQMLQASWLKQDGEQTLFNEHFESADLDYQMNFIYQDLKVDWGLNFRYSHIHYEPSIVLSSDSRIEHLRQYGGLLQLQYKVLPDLDLIAGVRVDHNELTGWENQPLAKAVWKPTNNQTLWGSISKSVRIPSLIEFNDNFVVNGDLVSEIAETPTGIPLIDNYRIRTYLNGNDQVEAEQSMSYELGYRLSQVSWAIDASLYYTDSKDVAVIQVNVNEAQFAPVIGLLQLGQIDAAYQALTTTSISYDLVSQASVIAQGGDLTLTWQASESVKTEFGVSYNDFKYVLPPNTVPAIGYDSVTKQYFAKFDWQIFPRHSFFATVRYEDSTAYNVDNYTALDLAWNWDISPQWRLSILGKNLIAGEHLEYGNTGETFTIPNYIDESVAVKIRAKF